MEKSESLREKHNQKILDDAFGSDAGRALQDRKFLFDSLASESWKQRYCAIKFLREHWCLESDLLWPLYRNHFENEKHLQVQLVTLRQIGLLFRESYDDSACSYLAKIALSDEHENRIRRTAFESINKIRQTEIDAQFSNPSVDDLLARFEAIKMSISDRQSEELPDWDLGLLRELAADD